MKISTLVCIISFECFAGFAQTVPGTLSYQGILMQLDGITPLGDGTHSIEFNFYDAVSGGNLIGGIGSRTVSVNTVKGLFTCIIGDGSGSNAALPFSLGMQAAFIGIKVDGGNELSPRAQLTTTLYAFQAQSAYSISDGAVTTNKIIDGAVTSPKIAIDAVDNAKLANDAVNTTELVNGSVTNLKLASGIDAAKLTTGTLPAARIAVGDIDNTKLASGIDATKITSGVLSGSLVGSNVTGFNLVDGSVGDIKLASDLNASKLTSGTLPAARIAPGDIDNTKLASGIDAVKITTGVLPVAQVPSLDASKITTGTLASARLDVDLQDLADGSLTGSLVGSGINATNITTGTIANARLDTDLQDLADGSLSGTLVGSGINADNLASGTVDVSVGGTGSTSATGARTNLGIASGTYVPSFSSLVNIAAIPSSTFSYVVVGTYAVVSGEVSIDPTAGGNCSFTVTNRPPGMPVLSNCFGVLTNYEGGFFGDVRISGSSIVFNFTVANGTSRTLRFVCTMY